MSRSLPILTALLLLSASAHSQTIKTIAGGGPHNIPVLQTSLPCPYIAVDTAGNTYCSATQFNQIWKIGVYNAGFWVLDVNGNGSFDGVGPGQDRFNGFGGTPGNQPLIGRW